MSGLNGADVLKRLRREGIDSSMIVLTMHKNGELRISPPLTRDVVEQLVASPTDRSKPC